MALGMSSLAGLALGCWGHGCSSAIPPQPHRYTAASVIDTASKYKLLWKLPLEDVDIVKGLSLPAGVSHPTPPQKSSFTPGWWGQGSPALCRGGRG